MSNLKKLISKDGLPITFSIFYLVGLGLFFIPATHGLFVILTPYSLVLVVSAFLYYHPNWNSRSIIFLLFVFIVSILAEIIGVKTGLLFGTYEYQTGLGIKIAEAPILIGVNWIILVYGSNSIIGKITNNKFYKVFGASLLMVVFDIILEFAAPLFRMWTFEGGYPPIQNFLMWFVLALVFNTILEALKVNTDNKPARALFIIQFTFFLIIVFFSLIFKL